MNKKIVSSTSTSSSDCKVVSTYFSDNDKDDSADFQDKRTFLATNATKKNSDIKKKRRVKKLKGQKDIRAALNPKKSELVRYSKEFSKVCKLSGIDVDSEKLQIAIALSKSLQNCEVDLAIEASSSKSYSIQDSTTRIRTTLQEYGFKVPQVKIEKKINRRKKSLKQYKLLTVSDSEKQQIITDKYSQVLFENLHSSQEQCPEDVETGHLYNIATNISYTDTKDINIFYVKNFLERSSNSIGTLLKDWLTIPGRPESPSNDNSNQHLSNINYSQPELDKILSGNLLTAQSIVKAKIEETINTALEENAPLQITPNNIGLNIENNIMDKNIEFNCKNIETLTIKSDCGRSCSPDIFDDEVSSILENSHEHQGSISTIPVTTFKCNNDFMDLTECVQQMSQNLTKNTLSQGSNVTKRKSNDLMEITNCITNSSQPFLVHNPININKSKVLPLMVEPNYIEVPKFIEVLEIDKNSIKINVGKDIDLTQDSPPNSKCNLHNSETTETKGKMYLTQSLDSFEDFPIATLNNEIDRGLDDTIILEEKEYTHIKSPIKPIHIESDDEMDNELGPTDIKTVYSSKEEILDLTLEIQQSPTIECEEDNLSSCKTIEKLDACKDGTDEIVPGEKYLRNEDLYIDLTQNLDKNYRVHTIELSPKISLESLGKKDNLSVDYDEILYDMPDNNSGVIEYVPKEKTTEFCDIIPGNRSKLYEENSQIKSFSNLDVQSNYNTLSQHSDIFEISDNELDYSMQQSRLENQKENFKMGTPSILDNISKTATKSLCSNRVSRSISESFLPEVDIIKRLEPMSNTEKPTQTAESQPSTPLKNYNPDVTSIDTPKGEYIIKIDQVTPMLDFASLSTPERNNELEKFGLKPFKRKRAIQLLTHLYNQTHPIVETCPEDLPCPSKKLKKDNNSQQCMLPMKKFKYLTHAQQDLLLKKKVRSPGKAPKRSKSPGVDVNKDNNILNYEVTNDILDIRNSDCDPDGWVFQKREKAKVHSCRLPLHIAFHNYVSCRKGLQEAILRYEPVHIDVIHKDLAAMGLRYDPKDLLKFLDKKCITVKTADNNSRNIRK